MKRKPYRKYSDEIRNEVIRSGNPRRFPELKIPKSTAHDWLKSSEHGKRITHEKFNFEKRLGIQKIRKFLELVLRCLPDELVVGELNAEERLALLSELQTNQRLWSGILPIRIRTKLGIHLKHCEETADGLCSRRFPGRLSKAEVMGMRAYVESPVFAHLSVASLVHLARRNGDVNCNSKTWYKYIQRLNWQRPPKPILLTSRMAAAIYCKC